jgi:cyclophilin family peptidyl-prolyl cis-trans isomerase
MNRFALLGVPALLFAWAAESPAQSPAPEATESMKEEVVNAKVLLKTSMGDVVLELFADKAPVTVRNFLGYVDDKFYDGTIFHRVISSFVIQGGGFTPDMVRKPTKDPILNEADNGLSNRRGTIAMARLAAPHSATSQFYINVQDNPNLDMTAEKPGYCVFGQVIEGMDVVDQMRQVQTAPKPPLPRDVPVETIELISATRVGEGEEAGED